MSLRALPAAKVFERPKNFQWEAPAEIFAKWADKPLAAEGEQTDTITIYDVIGEDFWSGGGFTLKRASAALRSIGPKPVTVRINSPGGDMFEGIAIYNLFRQHPAKVSVEVMGWAASAASVIAMAGDEVVMGLGTFMMVHNAWGLVIGNRHDMRDAADLFDGFDSALVDIYAARTGRKRSDVEALMDAETFMGASDAVKQGFADRVDEALKADSVAPASSGDSGVLARRRVEAALAKANFPRAIRSELIQELVANPTSAALRDASRNPAARDAGVTAAMRQLLETLNS